jgi:hypothetical protein
VRVFRDLVYSRASRVVVVRGGRVEPSRQVLSMAVWAGMSWRRCRGSSACENVGKAKSKPGQTRVGALSTAGRGRADCPTVIGILDAAINQDAKYSET